ncbi:MAG: LolA family protein [Terriglobales bacterium]
MIGFLLLLLFAGTGPVAPGPPPLRQLVRIVDARYDSLTTLRADFTEIYSQNGLGRRESGVLYLRKPGQMRWDYESPRKKVFLVTRRRVWLYLPDQHQAQVRSLKSAADLKTPLRWLLGKLDLPRELADMTYGGLNPLWPGDFVIRGVPTALGPRFREVLIEVSPAYNIRRIVIRAANGVQTDFRLRHIAANISLPERLFRFHPPPGVQVAPAPLP